MKKNVGVTVATAAHLAALGFAGPIILSVLGALAVTSVSTILIAGVGLLLFPLVAILVWAIAWGEEARVSSLFGMSIPSRSMPRSQRTDWLRIPHTLLKQFTDRSNLRSLLHFAIITLFGAASVFAWKSVFWGVAMLNSNQRNSGIGGLFWGNFSLTGTQSVILGISAILLSLLGVWLLTLAHRAVSSQILLPSREAEFAEQARESSRRRDEATRAAEVERTRIERDLHDGVQPRLVSVGITLGMAKAKIASDPEAAAVLIDEAHTSTKAAITELRQLARGIHPAVLADRGLDAALSAVAARSHIPVHLDVRLQTRCTPESEAAMYFAVSETLTNSAKHSGASSCRVTILQRPGGVIWARIEDDGRGGAHRVPGGGIDGVANRVAAAGGSMFVNSPVGGPTTIEVSIPCAF